MFVKTDKWHAEYTQINMQTDTLIFYRLPRHTGIHSNLQTLAKGLLLHTLQLGPWEKL